KGIAEKSDLLALNAALEGAKSGEVGKGFSLIAEEMRKLAENVGESAQGIRRISEEIQESGQGAQQRAELGVRSSDEALKVAERAFEGFQLVLQLTEKTTGVMQQIAMSSREQLVANDEAFDRVQRIGSELEKSAEATLRAHRAAGELERLGPALGQGLPGLAK